MEHYYQRKCKECGVVIDNSRQLCDSCKVHLKDKRYFIKYGKKRHTCTDCGVKVRKGQHRCSIHKKIQKEKTKERRKFSNRKYKVCVQDSCNEKPTSFSRYCHYHSPRERKKRYFEEIIHCIDCDIDLGKRKDWKKHKKVICDDCRTSRKIRSRTKQRESKRKWFKNKYHNDEEFRLKYLEYQKNYLKQKNKLNSN